MNTRRKRRSWRGILCVIAGLPVAGVSQSSLGSPGADAITSTSAAAGTTYVSMSALPSPMRAYLAAFGKRIQIPGKEQTTLNGTYTDKSGSGAASLIWQAPGSLRFVRPGSAAVLIYNTATGLVYPAAVAQSDADVLESLLDDAVESFLYNSGRNYAYRLLGQRFRSDNGKTPNFKGPWYDVYNVAGLDKSQPVATRRWKFYYIDSTTHLLAMTQYTDTAGNKITTQFNNWLSNGGESYPGQIVRIENGSPVFTFTVTGASFGPAAAGNLFSGN